MLEEEKSLPVEKLDLLTMQSHPLRPIREVIGLVTAVSQPLIQRDVEVDVQELHRRGMLEAVGSLKLLLLEQGANALVGLRFVFNSQLGWDDRKGNYQPVDVVAAYGTAVILGETHKESWWEGAE